MKTVSLRAWLSNSRVQTDLMDLELVEIGSSRRIRPVLVIQTALFHVIRLFLLASNRALLLSGGSTSKR